MEKVQELRLQDNALDRSAVPQICDLIELCSYMTRLDLRRNKLDDSAIADLQTYIERIPGVTGVVRDPVSGDIRAKSGPQMRLIVNLEDQGEPDPDKVAGDPLADNDDPSGESADNFLNSAAGVSTAAKMQGPMGGATGARTMMSKQQGGVTTQQSILPR